MNSYRLFDGSFNFCCFVWLLLSCFYVRVLNNDFLFYDWEVVFGIHLVKLESTSLSFLLGWWQVALIEITNTVRIAWVFAGFLSICRKRVKHFRHRINFFILVLRDHTEHALYHSWFLDKVCIILDLWIVIVDVIYDWLFTYWTNISLGVIIWFVWQIKLIRDGVFFAFPQSEFLTLVVWKSELVVIKTLSRFIQLVRCDIHMTCIC